MNTRKFPRTMNEAFPFGPEYGCSITRYERFDGHKYIVPTGIICLAILLVLFAIGAC